MAQFALSSLLGILSNGNRAISTVGGRATAEITNVALAASAVYTQAWQDSQANGATYVGGSVVADQAGTLYVDFADDQTYPLDSVEALSFTPATAGTPNASKLSYAVHITTRYYRFRYVNGATAQGTFELFQTPLHTAPQNVSLFGSSAPLVASLDQLIANYVPTGTTNVQIATYNPSYLSLMRKKAIFIDNSANQSVTLSFYPSLNGMNPSSVNALQAVVAAGFQAFIGSSFIVQQLIGAASAAVNSYTLDDPFDYMVIFAQYNTLPTSGNLNAWLRGTR